VKKSYIIKNRVIRAFKMSKFLRKTYRQIKKYTHSVKKRLLPPVLEFEGVKIFLGAHISPTIESTIYNGCYEKAEIELLKAYLSQNDTVMEIGAGIGFLSSYCARNIGSEKVFAYEANPALELPIRRTYRINGVNPLLEICLIGRNSGTKNFYITRNFWASSFVEPLETIDRTVKVASKSFSREIARVNPSFLIVDIEGGEYELFEGADLHGIQKIIIELHPSVIGKSKATIVKNKLKEMGFKIVAQIPNCDDEILFLEHI
jgi:FkbM family methyltransferase